MCLKCGFVIVTASQNVVLKITNFIIFIAILSVPTMLIFFIIENQLEKKALKHQIKLNNLLLYQMLRYVEDPIVDIQKNIDMPSYMKEMISDLEREFQEKLKGK